MLHVTWYASSFFLLISVPSFLYNILMTHIKQPSKGEIIIYKTKGGETQLEVKLEKETVWLSQSQIAQLFNTERSVVTKHIGNIFKSQELIEKSNVQKMHIPNSDRPTKFFSLDVIISVGYRVNSARATQFRIWATQTLKNYLIQGYVLNQKKLEEQAGKLRELQNAYLRSDLFLYEYREYISSPCAPYCNKQP